MPIVTKNISHGYVFVNGGTRLTLAQLLSLTPTYSSDLVISNSGEVRIGCSSFGNNDKYDTIELTSFTFDLTSIPAGSSINSVSLGIYINIRYTNYGSLIVDKDNANFSVVNPYSASFVPIVGTNTIPLNLNLTDISSQFGVGSFVACVKFSTYPAWQAGSYIGISSINPNNPNGAALTIDYTAGPNAPIADAATLITHNSFSANWH